MPLFLLFYCKSGFENDCAAEVVEYTKNKNIDGFIKAKPNSAHIIFQSNNTSDIISLWNDLQIKDLIFARQILLSSQLYSDLPDKNRTTPIFEAFEENFGVILNQKKYLDDLFVEALDTDQHKEILTFCKKFTSPMLSELRKNKYILGDKNNPSLRMHLLFLNSKSCYIAISAPKKASPWFMGIPRLKLPIDAPSRSTLKLEEAFITFLTENECATRLKSGSIAVDLGASPGGWTYQFVRRNIYVYAIDNGKMDPKLLKSGFVEHLKEDGFKFRPKKSVDWMVCDMVEKPTRIVKLVAEWAVLGIAKEFIFNLKLPMKKKYQAITECLTIINDELNLEGISFKMKCKHLYHDRDEVTVWLRLV